MPYGVGQGFQRMAGIERLRAQNEQARAAQTQHGLAQMAQAAQGIQAQQKKAAVDQDIQNVLGGADPTTMEGAQVKYKMEQDASATGIAQERNRMAAQRDEDRWIEQQDRYEAGQREEARGAEERAGYIRGGRRRLGLPDRPSPAISESPMGPVVGALPGGLGMPGPTTQAGIDMALGGQAGAAAGAERGRKGGLEERKMRLGERAEERRGRPEPPDPDAPLNRRLLEAKVKKAEAEAERTLERDFPTVKPLTRTAAVSAAVSVLLKRTDDEGLAVVPTAQEVIDTAKAILKGVNVQETTPGGTRDPLEDEWAERTAGGR